MNLLFGGAYQGKLSYLLAHSDYTFADCHDCAEGYSEKAPVLYHFEQYILELVHAGHNAMAYITAHLTDYMDKTIVIRDISCGVVPVDPILRLWREEVGRVTRYLAEHAQQVYRIYCGIATPLK